LVTRQAGARVVIKFWGDGFDFLMQRGPMEGRAWITLDGQRVPMLPLDTNGNSYVDLAAPNDEWQVRVPVAKDIPRRTHTVELVVGQTGEVAFDGFVVYANGAHEFPWQLVAGLGVLLIVSSALFARSCLRARKSA
jgi:hypothetical protein